MSSTAHLQLFVARVHRDPDRIAQLEAARPLSPV